MVEERRAWLLDAYPQRERMALWFITDRGQRLRLFDAFAPSFYVADLGRAGLDAAALAREIGRIKGFAYRGPAQRLDFWTDRPREVFEIRVTDLDRYGLNLRGLFRRRPQLTYFNCDILPEVEYGYATGLFPTARCVIQFDGERLVACRVEDDPLSTAFELPPLRTAELRGDGALTGKCPRLRSLTLTVDGRSLTWEDCPPPEMLASLREALEQADPDLVWSVGGDSLLFGAIFSLAQRFKIPTGLDREPGVQRRLVFDGRSYISYGRVLYQAPDYPLFGRWHLDRANSFWVDEAGLEGLIEVCRMSKLPVQRAARRSIGTGITSIQLDLAYREGYLIPWKKSQPEAWKTAAALLKSDRGGLVYQPLVGVYEDVIELDFASMYPTIMARFNVSPETIDCGCCEPQPAVPELGYSICRRRRGLVSRSLEPIIAKRAAYKALRKQAREAGEREAAARFDARQGALKWLLVCCFGYLGYRNARFGRIEAHESTTAFSREMLLRAMDVCERRGFRVLHAIVDSFWLQKPGATDAEIEALCAEIERATELKIALEGRYGWLVFLPSRRNPDMPVPNRYFGGFRDGGLKFRGIELRRSDQAPFAQRLQETLLDRLRGAADLAECRGRREELLDVVREAQDRLRTREVPLAELIFRRKTSMEAEEYKSNNMTAVAARQARRAGLSLHAGQSVYFLALDSKNADPDERLRITAFLRPEDHYDVEFYVRQMREAAATILEPILGGALGELLGEAPPAPARRRKARPPDEGMEQLDFLAAG